MSYIQNRQPVAAIHPGEICFADDDSHLSKELIAAHQPFAPEIEAMRALRTQLMLGGFSTTANGLAIVSPSSGDGRTFIASNLAIVFSQLGKRTLLVDAHLRNARVHDLFGLPNTPGLAAALADGRTSALTPVSVPQFKNLGIVPAGVPPANADDLLARDSFREVCRWLMTQFDVVLFDTPPGGSSSGADWVADRCGKVLLVVRQGHTRFVETESFVRRIQSRAQMVGSVMNNYRRPLWRRS